MSQPRHPVLASCDSVVIPTRHSMPKARNGFPNSQIETKRRRIRDWLGTDSGISRIYPGQRGVSAVEVLSTPQTDIWVPAFRGFRWKQWRGLWGPPVKPPDQNQNSPLGTSWTSTFGLPPGSTLIVLPVPVPVPVPPSGNRLSSESQVRRRRR